MRASASSVRGSRPPGELGRSAAASAFKLLRVPARAARDGLPRDALQRVARLIFAEPGKIGVALVRFAVRVGAGAARGQRRRPRLGGRKHDAREREMNVGPSAPESDRKIGRQRDAAECDATALGCRNFERDRQRCIGNDVDRHRCAAAGREPDCPPWRRAAGDRQRERQRAARERLAGCERRELDSGEVTERVEERRCREAREQERRRETQRQRVVERREQHDRDHAEYRDAASRRQDVDPVMAEDHGVVVAGLRPEQPLAKARAPQAGRAVPQVQRSREGGHVVLAIASADSGSAVRAARPCAAATAPAARRCAHRRRVDARRPTETPPARPRARPSGDRRAAPTPGPRRAAGVRPAARVRAARRRRRRCPRCRGSRRAAPARNRAARARRGRWPPPAANRGAWAGRPAAAASRSARGDRRRSGARARRQGRGSPISIAIRNRSSCDSGSG